MAYRGPNMRRGGDLGRQPRIKKHQEKERGWVRKEEPQTGRPFQPWEGKHSENLGLRFPPADHPKRRVQTLEVSVPKLLLLGGFVLTLKPEIKSFSEGLFKHSVYVPAANGRRFCCSQHHPFL